MQNIGTLCFDGPRLFMRTAASFSKKERPFCIVIGVLSMLVFRKTGTVVSVYRVSGTVFQRYFKRNLVYNALTRSGKRVLGNLAV